MERTYTLHDVLAALKRRRAVALVAAAIVGVVGAIAALAVPSEYSATSVTQIEPRRLPADFFPAQNVTAYEDRMRTIKHGILARPVLERVIRETDFYPDLREDMDQAVARMRRDVEVRLEGEVPAGPPALLFVVEVHGRDREKVAKAADLLPRVYGELTRKVLESQARNLRQMLDAQTAEMAKGLSEGETRILDFKVKHQAELPEMVETNARSIGRLQALVQMRNEWIADARRRRSEVLAAAPEGPSVAGMAEAGHDGVLRHLKQLESTYGPNHPDVRRTRRELEQARARRDEELKRFKDERVGQHVAAIDEEIRDNRESVASLQKELDRLQARVDAAPRWGAELAALTRDYEVLRGRYVTLVARRSDAAAAEALLAADDPTMFRTVESAVTPSRPSAPDRPRLLWLAVLAGVVAGLCAAGITEWLDASMRGPEDAATLGVPVLATIPRIGPRGRRAP
ncbi:MAG TPA: lipopolysaccharide biosynthesis protein [Anaeromyxobacter sp.]|nr:lipopolysaccharide biosynthesis protein [Anaeromyxobacter sp.]